MNYAATENINFQTTKNVHVYDFRCPYALRVPDD